MIFVLLVFMIVIAAELYYAKKHGLRVYSFASTASHFTMGIGQQALNLLSLPALIGAYVALHENFRLLDLQPSDWRAWVGALLLADFSFYWAHRICHRSNFFVGAHVVHHQAEDFNHGSAIRQSWTSRPVMFLFYTPLAILGFPVQMLLGVLGANFLIQFFSHNGVIRRKLGMLEYVLVTPRTHFVHHGTNGPYLDKNFGGVFIFWDRLFGTFQDLDEKQPIQIGPLEGPNHYDPIYANLNYYQRIAFVAGHRRGFLAKLAIWFQSPERLEVELDRLGYVEEMPRPPLVGRSREAKLAILGILGMTTLALLFLVGRETELDSSTKIAIAALVIFGAYLSGRLLNSSVKAYS